MGALSQTDHERLLTLARRINAAAGDGDVERLRRAVTEFADALADHLQTERPRMASVTPAEERILRRGQARLWSSTSELLHDARGSCEGRRGACASHAEELLAQLTMQAHDEARSLADPSYGVLKA